jgi:two-component system, cell cycle sensor histidine kinase and response regulator CckA
VCEGTETILLVEDAEMVRTVIVEVLESYGYTVLSAASGVEALELVASNGAIDLLLTDMVMPEMHGPELAERLAATHPSVKMLFTSGYPSGATMSEAADADVAFIQKPYLADELAHKVRSVVDAPSS